MPGSKSRLVKFHMCRVLGWSHQSSCSSASKATPMVDPAELHVTAETLRPRIYLEMVYVI